MIESNYQCFFMFLVIGAAIVQQICAQLTPDFYDEVCPTALETIREVVENATSEDRRMGASLLRLHFHDCFVNGCDGSILLNDTGNFRGEQTAPGNKDSARGFNVINDIKAAVNVACNGNIVSCADILAVAARDSVSILGGQWYEVLLGRRDATTASLNDSRNDIPTPFFNLTQLIQNFQNQGLNLQDLVVLSGAHTVGFAHCGSYKFRIYNDTNIDPQFRDSLKKDCPFHGSSDNLAPFDTTPTNFDTFYFQALTENRGLLHSDQELYKNDGSQTDKLVEYYSNNPDAFWKDFGQSMIRMGNIKPLTGQAGEIRFNCSRVN